MRLLATTLLAFLLLAPSWAAPLRSLVLVQWSDLHYGERETVPGDWSQALGQGLALAPDALLMTGDHVDNKCPPEEFGRRLEAFLGSSAPRLSASRRPLLLALGNNDFPENYQTDPSQVAPVLAAWRRHLGKAFYLDDLGNGVYPRPLGGLCWISLNSLVFSPLDRYPGRGDQARRTLEGLRRQLAELPPGRPVAILSHIPPTWDLYSSTPAWNLEDLARFRDLLEGSRHPVVVLSGHFHRNEVHALSLSGGRAVPVLDAGALSGKYGANPNFRSYRWDLDGASVPQRVAWRLRYVGHPGWDRDWQFERPFQARTWSATVIRLASDPRFYRRYMEDLWARSASWPRDAEKPGTRQAVLDQFFVRPGVPVP